MKNCNKLGAFSKKYVKREFQHQKIFFERFSSQIVETLHSPETLEISFDQIVKNNNLMIQIFVSKHDIGLMACSEP